MLIPLKKMRDLIHKDLLNELMKKGDDVADELLSHWSRTQKEIQVSVTASDWTRIDAFYEYDPFFDVFNLIGFLMNGYEYTSQQQYIDEELD